MSELSFEARPGLALLGLPRGLLHCLLQESGTLLPRSPLSARTTTELSRLDGKAQLEPGPDPSGLVNSVNSSASIAVPGIVIVVRWLGEFKEMIIKLYTFPKMRHQVQLQRGQVISMI